MKTLILTPVLTLFFAFTVFAGYGGGMAYLDMPAMNEEAYINDIPFNTMDIAGKAIMGTLSKKYNDEKNVNDIPFNTNKIALEARLKEILKADQEAYVDDIPFNTRKIYYNTMIDQYTRNFRNEENVKDIPFSTTEIACQYFVDEYQNEKAVNDIRFDTYAISNNYQFQVSVKEYRNEANTADLPLVMCDPVCRLTNDCYTIHFKNSSLSVEKPQLPEDFNQIDEEMIRMDLEKMMQKLNDWDVKWQKMTLE